MARSFSIAAYAALFAKPARRGALILPEKRPTGAVIWARCAKKDQVTAVHGLMAELTRDGDDLTTVVTLPTSDSEIAGHPVGTQQTQAFFEFHRPSLVIWFHDALDPIHLSEISRRGLPHILLNAQGSGLAPPRSDWMPWLLPRLIRQFDAIMAVDKNAAWELKRQGALASVVRVTGALQDITPTLNYHEHDRVDLAEALGSRPVWLAAMPHMDELPFVLAAHRQACRRSHRLLLLIAPRRTKDARAMASQLRTDGYIVACRVDDEEPDDNTQVYIADGPGEMGLWYRMAPITYLGGTLLGGKCRDPYEAAALGSAVIAGPNTAPHRGHFAMLEHANAYRPVTQAAELGGAVETLLSSEKAAELAHGGWDVTSSGAEMLNQLVTVIRDKLDSPEV